MKTLIIIGIILGVFTTYFVFNAQKSISVKGGGNAIPAGTDIAKLILNKVKTISPGEIIGNIISDDENNKINGVFQSNITEKIRSKVGELKNTVLNEGIDLIKKTIENKAGELFCPQN